MKNLDLHSLCSITVTSPRDSLGFGQLKLILNLLSSFDPSSVSLLFLLLPPFSEYAFIFPLFFWGGGDVRYFNKNTKNCGYPGNFKLQFIV